MSKRPRRVVLTSVIVDAIDNALDVVLAHAALIVTARQEARTGFDHQVAERIELCRSARMREMSPAQRGWTLPRAPGERELGGEVVDSSEIIAPLNHVLTITSHSSIRSHAASTAASDDRTTTVACERIWKAAAQSVRLEEMMALVQDCIAKRAGF